MDECKIRDINLTCDEVSRLEKAFSNQKFKKLFGEYLNDLQDPEKLEAYENEITEFEKQRGNDVLFIKPAPHYVLKTSVDGNAKAYINILACPNINQLTIEISVSGLNVSIPYSLSPVHKICAKRKETRYVYSVIFHPSTLKKADSNDGFKNAVHKTAFDAIEKTFKVNLDKVNVKLSKKSFKGALETTIIRKNCSKDHETSTISVPDENYLALNDLSKEYSKPSYKIVYRNVVDLQNSTTDKFCKMNVLIPQLMIVEIQLPLLKSIAKSKLDVRETSIQFMNEDPKYKLDLTLPYQAYEKNGNAKFNADLHVLTIELPVRRKISKVNAKSGLSELISEVGKDDHKKLVSEADTTNGEMNGAITHEKIKSNIWIVTNDERKLDESLFLNPNIRYKLPSFKCNYLKNRLAFSLNVKNVIISSFEYVMVEKGFWVKFTSLGSGHFSMYYCFYVQFIDSIICPTNKAIDHKIEDDCVFIYVSLKDDCLPLEYFAGLNEKCKQKYYLNELEAFELELNNKKPKEDKFDIEVIEINKKQVVMNLKSSTKKNDNNQVGVNIKSDTSTKEEFIFHSEKPVHKKLSKLEDKFRTQFSLDDEPHSLSESELLVQRSNRSSASHTETNSDIDNKSWVVEDKNMKKTKREKKARDEPATLKEAKRTNNVIENIEEESALQNATSEPVDIKSAYIYSDTSSRSILKKHRSFSESSGDETFIIECSRSYSADEMNFSSDSYSTSCPKKNVTFNDVISKKLYSSDISILEAQKRAKRRNRRKERRSSDSENSETENSASVDEKRQNIREFNNALLMEKSENELTSVSESGGETSDDQSDKADAEHSYKKQLVSCSKKNHKRRGKKSARKNASTAKHRYHID